MSPSSGAEQGVDIWKHDFVELQLVRDSCITHIRVFNVQLVNIRCQQHLILEGDSEFMHHTQGSVGQAEFDHFDLQVKGA